MNMLIEIRKTLLEGSIPIKIKTVPLLPSTKSLKKKILSFSDEGGGYFVIGYSPENDEIIDASNFYCQDIFDKCQFDEHEGLVGTYGFKKIDIESVFVIEVFPSKEYFSSFVDAE